MAAPLVNKFVPVIKTIAEVPAGEATTLLYYGPSGTGKTWFCGTAGDRTLFINIGRGKETLLSPLFKKLVGSSGMMIVDIDEKIGERGRFESATMFDAVCDTIDWAIANIRDKFDTIVLDDATQLRRGAMNKGYELNGAMNRSKTLATAKLNKFDLIVPAMQDYSAEMSLIDQFISSYTVLSKEHGFHFVMTAHSRNTYGKPERQADEAPLLKIGPGFTGKTFPDDIPGYFENVWYSECVGSADNVVYRARTAGDEKLTAKSRNGGVFEVVEKNPNFLAMMKRVKDGNTNAKFSSKK